MEVVDLSFYTAVHGETQKPMYDYWFFECPGCGYGHEITVHAHRGTARLVWSFDRSGPTFGPSLLCEGVHRCHSFLRQGFIEFLGDCSHKLANKRFPFRLKEITP